ncbi:MAG: type II toxin-antitoxin system PemK/MazF family toxin [SAR202 cluster bacterium]|nr:type II toxin-antitoxin system PemK/MazF family toxin [SAR202 cluster bacterium]
MRRGEVWWANLPPPTGRRPVVLLSRDEAYSFRELVTIAPVTTRTRGIRSEVALGPEDGLPRICAANLDSITTIPKNTLQQHIVSLPGDKLQAVNHALHFALGLDAVTG